MKKLYLRKWVSFILASMMMATFSLSGFVYASDSSTFTETSTSNVEPKGSGYVYGPWFGDGNVSWSTNPKGWAHVAGDLGLLLSFYMPSPTAMIIGNAIHFAADQYIDHGDDIGYFYGDIHKEYREVHYSDDSFAFFETRYEVDTYYVDENGYETYLGREIETYRGQFPMNLD